MIPFVCGESVVMQTESSEPAPYGLRLWANSQLPQAGWFVVGRPGALGSKLNPRG